MMNKISALVTLLISVVIVPLNANVRLLATENEISYYFFDGSNDPKKQQAICAYLDDQELGQIVFAKDNQDGTIGHIEAINAIIDELPLSQHAKQVHQENIFKFFINLACEQLQKNGCSEIHIDPLEKEICEESIPYFEGCDFKYDFENWCGHIPPHFFNFDEVPMTMVRTLA